MAEKLGTVRQDPDLHGLLFLLISRATGGRQERGSRGARRSHLYLTGVRSAFGLRPSVSLRL